MLEQLLSADLLGLLSMVVLLGGCAAGGSGFPRPAVPEAPERSPRTLLLALDGVPYRVIEEARRQGAFAGWPEAAALVAPFPSMTSVAFTEMFASFGVEAADGYELHHYDFERNEVRGGSPFGYKGRSYGWKQAFDVTGKNLPAKLAQFAIPRTMSHWEMKKIGEELLASPREVVLGYVGSTDGVQHLRGDGATTELLLELRDTLEELRDRHEEERGRPLRVVLFSDHGCTAEKIHAVKGLRRNLKGAGFHVRDRLDGPDDVVAATFGMTGYVALYLGDPPRAPEVAEIVVQNDGVDLAVWNGTGHVTVLSGSGRGEVFWEDDPGGRRYAYRDHGGDPLRLAAARDTLEAAGELDARGFGSDAAWFEASVDETYPDALKRLVDAFEGHAVRNRAHVLLSFGPDRAWGWRSARMGAWVSGGRLEGTHGALERESTLGFFLSDDPSLMNGRAVRTDTALEPFARFYNADWPEVRTTAE